jgi:hypothetical protein
MPHIAIANAKNRVSRANPERGVSKMKNVVASLYDAAQKRVAYRRTVAELNDLPRNVKDDLDIAPRNIPSIAHRAVYGF